MIEIRNPSNKFELEDRCNSCLGENNIKIITYYHNQNQTSSFRLCKACKVVLKRLLELQGDDK